MSKYAVLLVGLIIVKAILFSCGDSSSSSKNGAQSNANKPTDTQNGVLMAESVTTPERDYSATTSEQFVKELGWLPSDILEQSELRQPRQPLAGEAGLYFSMRVPNARMEIDLSCDSGSSNASLATKCLEYPLNRKWIPRQIYIYEGANGHFCYRMLVEPSEADHGAHTVLSFLDVDGDGRFETFDLSGSRLRRFEVPAWVKRVTASQK